MLYLDIPKTLKQHIGLNGGWVRQILFYNERKRILEVERHTIFGGTLSDGAYLSWHSRWQKYMQSGTLDSWGHTSSYPGLDLVSFKTSPLNIGPGFKRGGKEVPADIKESLIIQEGKWETETDWAELCDSSMKKGNTLASWVHSPIVLVTRNTLWKGKKWNPVWFSVHLCS